LNRKKIIILEDDQLIINLYKLLLKNEDYEIKIAQTPAEALKYLNQDKYSLIIADISLAHEGMEGIEFIKLIKNNEKFSSIPAIAVTGYNLKHDIDKILEAGYCECITKPIKTQEFKDLIKKYII